MGAALKSAPNGQPVLSSSSSKSSFKMHIGVGHLRRSVPFILPRFPRVLSGVASLTDEANLKPSEIVKRLDDHIIGQGDAKRAVAIALRNRWRRHKLPAAFTDEIIPKNILMIGPTGCGKTEIARRLSLLSEAPFIKVPKAYSRYLLEILLSPQYAFSLGGSY